MEDTTKIDADKQRDEKCIPIAQTVLEEISTGLMNTDENYNAITLKVISMMLDSDLNVASEVSYIFQLILGVFSKLNATIQECDILPNDDIRYNIITNKILSIVANAKVSIKGTPDEITTSFVSVKDELNKLFIEEKLTRLDAKYIMDNLLTSFTSLNNLVSRNIEVATERMECKILGIENMTDLSLKKLDETLKS